MQCTIRATSRARPTDRQPLRSAIAISPNNYSLDRETGRARPPYLRSSSEFTAIRPPLWIQWICRTRLGLEAAPLSQWLYSALAEAELPVVCVETRHMQAVLKAQINKTDLTQTSDFSRY